MCAQSQQARLYHPYPRFKDISEETAGRMKSWEENCEMLPSVHGVEPEYRTHQLWVSHKIKPVKRSCMNAPHFPTSEELLQLVSLLLEGWLLAGGPYPSG